jgi:hypothetical protein
MRPGHIHGLALGGFEQIFGEDIPFDAIVQQVMDGTGLGSEDLRPDPRGLAGMNLAGHADADYTDLRGAQARDQLNTASPAISRHGASLSTQQGRQAKRGMWPTATGR